METLPGRLVETFRLPGDPVQNVDLFSRSWDECVELQEQPKEIWIGQSLIAFQQMKRWELAFFIAQNFAGAIILAHDMDCHVGKCMSVCSQYVKPEYRNLGISQKLMRAGIRIARSEGARVLAFTHRQGPWRYSTIYHKLKENHEDPKD